MSDEVERTRVKVKLVAEHWVEIVVAHAPGESPTDLLPAERQEALSAAESVSPRWEIDKVERK